MSVIDYGTGTALSFTDGSQRQVLELGELIHMYNPDVTPIQTIGARLNHSITPVPIFEWMEDEYMIKRSIVLDVDATDSLGVINDLDTAGDNDTGSVIKLNRQAQMELFEIGGFYSVAVTGGVALTSGLTHVMCIGIGSGIDVTGADARFVQFIGFDAFTSNVGTYDKVATTAAMFAQASTAGTLSIVYLGNMQTIGALEPWAVKSDSLTDNDTGTVIGLAGHAEGADSGKETRKKVRRLKNCTQIFREPYTITGTAEAAQHYGGAELTRLQARKLAKLKTDLEWALITNGNYDLDALVENPQRTFTGLGVGVAGGAIQTFDGYDNTDLQLTYASGSLAEFDTMVSLIFEDMVDGSGKKTVFCSNKWMNKLVAMTRATTGTAINSEQGSDATAGLRVRKYYGPVGELEFVAHPLLKGAYENYAVGIDFSNFDMRPLRTRDLQLRDDIKKDGADGTTSEWLVELGPEIRNEQTHFIMKLV